MLVCRRTSLDVDFQLGLMKVSFEEKVWLVGVYGYRGFSRLNLREVHLRVEVILFVIECVCDVNIMLRYRKNTFLRF